MGRNVTEVSDLSSLSYTPGRLLDRVSREVKARTDNELSALLGCDPALICRIRGRKSQLSHWLMVRVMDVTGWSIKEVRNLAGMPFDGGMADPYYLAWRARTEELAKKRQKKLLRAST